jgi:hypothetical protein
MKRLSSVPSDKTGLALFGTSFCGCLQQIPDRCGGDLTADIWLTRSLGGRGQRESGVSLPLSDEDVAE